MCYGQHGRHRGSELVTWHWFLDFLCGIIGECFFGKESTHEAVDLRATASAACQVAHVLRKGKKVQN